MRQVSSTLGTPGRSPASWHAWTIATNSAKEAHCRHLKITLTPLHGEVRVAEKESVACGVILTVRDEEP